MEGTFKTGLSKEMQKKCKYASRLKQREMQTIAKWTQQVKSSRGNKCTEKGGAEQWKERMKTNVNEQNQ